MESGSEILQLVGVDPLAETPFRRFGAALESTRLAEFMTQSRAAILSRITAARLGLSTGDLLNLSIGGIPIDVRIVATLAGDNASALEGLLLVDISTAQELTHRNGTLDRIDLQLETEQADQLAASLPPGLRLEIPATRTRVMAEMIEAFQTNLAAMSLLAMVVGAFLIYNTMTFSVLRRMRLFGTLRLLGVTRRTLFYLVLFEAGLLAVAGTIAGLLAGIVTAQYLVHLVTRTINDLYFVLTVTHLMIEPLILFKGAAVGLGVTLLASLAPALDAAAATPIHALQRSRLEHRVRRDSRWLALLGLMLLTAGLLLTRPTAGGLSAGFTGLFLIIGGYSLMVPLAVNLFSHLTHRLPGSSALLTRLALRGITANLSRTGLAVAALCVAVAATLGVSIMITSFRATVSEWLDYTLRGDIYVSAADSGSSSVLDPAVRLRIHSLDIVAETSGGRRLEAMSDHGPVAMLALDRASGSHRGFRFAEPPVGEVWSGFDRGELILISEPYAFRQHMKTGDMLELQTPNGAVTMRVGGIFFDYGSDRGLITLSHSLYQRLWEDGGFSTIGVFLRPGVTTTEAIGKLHKLFGDASLSLRIRANRDIREQSLAVFDRTFAITQVLRLLAIGVAFVGVLSTLMALQLERTREQAILRAMGATRGQLSRLTILQTGIMGLYAGALSLPLGWLMSEVLIEVINRRSFGWSIASQLPFTAVAEALVLACVSALLAGLYPAWRMGQVPAALALREE